MDRETRGHIERATQAARRLLEEEVRAQLEGTFDVLPDGTIKPEAGPHLDEAGRLLRENIVAAIEHHKSAVDEGAEGVQRFARTAAFTLLNRFVALKMLEARELVQECVSRGLESSGFREFTALAPGLVPLGDASYHLYLECLFDELSCEVKVLFERSDAHGLLWPRRKALLELLEVLGRPELSQAWRLDETIGWVYQYFNSGDERRQMREASQAPRNSRELAVRNQFFTPRYVVQFLVDNTLGRTWVQMREGDTALLDKCEFFVRDADPGAPRAKKDPRDLKVLDPACGSGHFLLYAFDLLLVMYEEAWSDPRAPKSAAGTTLREAFPELEGLRRAAPALILEHNLHGVDIDARAAQIAALALWLRAQRALQERDVPRDERPAIQRTNVVVAEPMPGDGAMVESFAATLHPPLLGELFRRMVGEMRLAGELGTLLKVEEALADELTRAREQFLAQRPTGGFLPGLEPAKTQRTLDFSGIDDDGFFQEAEARIVEALRRFVAAAGGAAGVRRRLFAGDAAQGIALLDLLRTRFDVVLMNPPFGAGSQVAKKVFEKSYPRTKNDVYAAFVERGVGMLHPRGMLGAITSRTGFFLSSFQKWREEVLLKEAPPVVFADLGAGVLDSAMVEVAAYCLEAAG
jgi:hypothetical protein